MFTEGGAVGTIGERQISVILPAYNEAGGIERVIKEFSQIAEVKEVIVVDNNSTDGTGELAREAGARLVVEERRGYGFACRRGLLEASGDWICLVEPDGTFLPEDIYKFLTYTGEFDAVFGSRTSKACIWKGANMGLLMRYSNCAAAKYLEYLHNGPCLTDVGCTFKMISKRAVEGVADLLTVGGSHFSPQLMIALIRRGFRCVEIPIGYRERTGISKITGNRLKAAGVALRMVGLITRMRFQRV